MQNLYVKAGLGLLPGDPTHMVGTILAKSKLGSSLPGLPLYPTTVRFPFLPSLSDSYWDPVKFRIACLSVATVTGYRILEDGWYHLSKIQVRLKPTWSTSVSDPVEVCGWPTVFTLRCWIQDMRLNSGGNRGVYCGNVRCLFKKRQSDLCYYYLYWTSCDLKKGPWWDKKMWRAHTKFEFHKNIVSREVPLHYDWGRMAKFWILEAFIK